MSIKRIAILGPFDIENYGDHLFERVLVWKLHEKHPNAIVDVFTPTNGSHGFGDNIKRVYSIDSLESRHAKYHYAAFIVAGGSTIHFRTLIQNVRGKVEPYPLWKVWTVASVVASRYGIPLVWNNPEAPFDFLGWEKIVAHKLIEPVGYLSVRDSASKHSIEAVSPHTVELSDDPAFLLPKLLGTTILPEQLPPELQRNAEPLAIFHCNNRLNHHSSSSNIQALLQQIERKGYRVLLLPLAYTNQEQDNLREIHKQNLVDSLFIDRKLSLSEIATVFKRCSLYVGLSFHGAVSAYTFGATTIAFDYENRRKTKQLYERMGLSGNYHTEIEGAIEHIKSLPRAATINSEYSPPAKIITIQKALNVHFKKMLNYAETASGPPTKDLTEYFAISDYEITQKAVRDAQLQELSNGYKECLRQYHQLRDYVDKLGA